jgi:acetyl-CoA carboxylase biotin carboxylase subunit
VFSSVLIVNRGEIARRISRTVRRLGLRAIVVHSDADAGLPFVTEADEAILLEGPPATVYRDVEAILAAAKRSGAEAVHPGYGFLSENAAFARAVAEAGLAWIGPSPEVIESMGDKIAARNTVAAAGMPVAAGTPDPVLDADAAVTAAERIGYPVMIKAAAGGGGMGMAVATSPEEVLTSYERVRSVAERMFGDASVLLERYIGRARHVEVQSLGLADGRVVALGERDCSVQRRNQKVAEETPSPGLTPELRAAMLAAAVQAGERIGYRNAGTVECLVDVESGDFVFLEMNTRLQVEHPITEAVFGVDLVEEQLRVAAGEPPTFDPSALASSGHALELRVNAEDPKRFLPRPGTITRWEEPAGDGVRVDSGFTAGNTVTPYYDSLLAKLIVTGASREEVLARARTAVAGFVVEGVTTNLPFLAELLDSDEFTSGAYDTGIVGRLRP